ncbi:NADPH-dependent 2,4-dienoyl-CoA reductase/sulfur reductase-like enzyme [Sphingomonas vulcanisoli]|uniref:NADPH-dependent 2,4-dienoyl-CoA reductase/sulfur reductase-like enzyme n=1 Tax=Sphingomonas vulcanisoli TaxID=1658060 RepID=A0ABX0TXT8_9SPHN|nr:FAD-dependent oxidoreductase [Sphingomonas vulcanisoli]NIJ09245.1 NADPH-dependent 2,4-dienoyl-CoA reductase/sulfur reductase-like enzyme [Sphingomonas vulcanisoli]
MVAQPPDDISQRASIVDSDYLLIGGGVASYNAAKRIRRIDASARIVMVSDDSLPPYHLPPLSKEFLRGEQSEGDIVYPDLVAMGGPIDIHLSTSVTDLDPAGHEAGLDNGLRISFRKALLATGGTPILLPVPGAELEGIYYVRTANDARRIGAAAATARHAVVIGAGFIGLEVAASLRKLGLSVTVVEAQARIWPRFADPAIAEVVRERCAAEGVTFLTGERVESVNGDSHVRAVVTASGLEIECDLLCVGIGIIPNTNLASAAGLEIANGIVVDHTMQSSAPDIFAAGDVANYPDPICGRRLRAEHWGHAEYSGQLAARNMCGDAAEYDFINYAWSDVFDLHIESAGHIEDHDTVIVRGNISDTSFSSLYLNNGVLVGYCAVNQAPKEFATYRRLIRSHQPLSDHVTSLRDTQFDVRSLVSA